jgi:hypothetical protein
MARNNIFSELSRDFVSGDSTQVVDIISFAEAPWGLNMRLLPAQKFILKCFYGMELDDADEYIKVPNLTNERILYKFTEKTFLSWLYEEGRCNTDVVEGKQFQELILALGRRGSKSTIASVVSNYELYKLVRRGDPVKHYGFNPGAQFYILNVAPTDDQANVVFDMIQTQAMKCPYLQNRSVHNTMTYFDIQTDMDMAMKGKKPKASIMSLAGGCSSNALRGRNAIVVIMDEMAFFLDNSGRFPGSEVYKALTPSVASFNTDGKVICISSPYAKYGSFYERYTQSFHEQEITLMFQMYSAMANPANVGSAFLKAARRRDKTGFMCEFGAEFSDSVTAWVEDESEFRRCITNTPQPTKGVPGTKYFMGVDLGFKNDGASVAIVHRDHKTGKIILDYADVWFYVATDVWDFYDSI